MWGLSQYHKSVIALLTLVCAHGTPSFAEPTETDVPFAPRPGTTLFDRRYEDSLYGQSHTPHRRPRSDRHLGVTQFQSIANTLCANAHVLELEVFEGIDALPTNANYCELEVSELPAPVVELLGRLGQIHKNYAAEFEMRASDLFGFGVRLKLGEHPLGPLHSFTGGEIEMGVFADFKPSAFADKVYIHELTHWLLMEGKLGPAGTEIEPNFLFLESFPDLVASYVAKSTVIGFEDPSIRKALSFSRNGTPIQSMIRPFRDFYLGTFQQAPLRACDAITSSAQLRSENEKAMCTFFRTDREEKEQRRSLFLEARDRPPTAEELAATFNPDKCLIHYRDGTVGLNACFKNMLGPVLISFIHSLNPELGEKPLSSLLAAINTAAKSPEKLDCRYKRATQLASSEKLEPVTVSFASFVRVLKTLRQALTERGQTAFDTQWTAHGLETWEKLERYDRETVVAEFAYQVLSQANATFSAAAVCGSETPSSRGVKCAHTCNYVPGELPSAETLDPLFGN